MSVADQNNSVAARVEVPLAAEDWRAFPGQDSDRNGTRLRESSYRNRIPG